MLRVQQDDYTRVQNKGLELVMRPPHPHPDIKGHHFATTTHRDIVLPPTSTPRHKGTSLCHYQTKTQRFCHSRPPLQQKGAAFCYQNPIPKGGNVIYHPLTMDLRQAHTPLSLQMEEQGLTTAPLLTNDKTPLLPVAPQRGYHYKKSSLSIQRAIPVPSRQKHP